MLLQRDGPHPPFRNSTCDHTQHTCTHQAITESFWSASLINLPTQQANKVLTHSAARIKTHGIPLSSQLVQPGSAAPRNPKAKAPRQQHSNGSTMPWCLVLNMPQNQEASPQASTMYRKYTWEWPQSMHPTMNTRKLKEINSRFTAEMQSTST